MKNALENLSFAKAMIIICLLGSCALGWQIKNQLSDLQRQGRVLQPDGQLIDRIRQIQSLSESYTQLYESKDSESLRGMTNPQSYLVNLAVHEDVAVGQVDCRVSTRQLSTNVQDKVYLISPSLKDDTFRREQIANYLYKLENESRRVRVTDLVVEALNADGKKNLKPEEYPSDLWSFTFTVTSRQRTGDG